MQDDQLLLLFVCFSTFDVLMTREAVEKPMALVLALLLGTSLTSIAKASTNCALLSLKKRSTKNGAHVATNL